MANNVKINIDLESEDAAAELKRLAASFSKVEDAAEGADAAAGKLAQGGKKIKGFNSEVSKAATSTKQMDSSLNNFGAKFITLELAKKVAAYADATLTAAAANDQITGRTKETAKAYLEVKQNVADVASGMVLAAANIASSAFEVTGLNSLLADTAAAWREIAGLKQRSTEENDKANGYNIELSKLSALTREYRTLCSEYERYKDSNAEFAAVAKKGMGEVEAQIRKQNTALATYGQVLDDVTLKALMAGKTTAQAILSGDWDKQKKKTEEQAAKAKERYNAEQAATTATAEAVKASYGSQYDIIERTYNKETEAYKKALSAKKISQAEYDDAMLKALEARNAKVSALDYGDTSGGPGATDGGQAAADAAEAAKRSNEYRLQEEKNAKDAADKAVQIEKDKQTKIQELEKQTAQMREDSINTFMGGFANLSATMAQQNRKYASIAKAVAIAEATVNTYLGFTKALAQGGIFGAVAGAGVLASGFASVASIKAQKFADGGIVDGSSYSGDQVPVRVNSGEMILNKGQQAQLFKVAQGAQGVAPLSLTFNVSPGTDAVNLKKILGENASEFARQVAKVVRGPGFAQTQGAF